MLCSISCFNLHAQTQYCDTQIMSTDNLTPIKLSCENISTDTYRMTIEADDAIEGLGGTFMHINGTEVIDIRTAELTYSEDKKSLTVKITSTTAPNIYTPLYVLIPGEKVYNPGVIDWAVNCAGATIVDLNLATLKYDEIDVAGFSAAKTDYNIVLPEETTEIPIVTALAVEDAATVSVNITQATELPGSATIEVSEIANPQNVKIYTVNFSVSTASSNNECNGTLSDAMEGQGLFDIGYSYSFSTNAKTKEVTANFKLLDKKIGIVAFAWTYNPDFAETQLTEQDGIFSKIFTVPEGITTFKVACKFAYAGGMAITKQLEYTVGASCAATGVETVQEIIEVVAYPNPVKEILNIIASNKIINVSIFGIDGKLINNSSPKSENANINVSDLDSGTYIVYITTADGQQIVKKIIK